jgi:hypothetical protein
MNIELRLEPFHHIIVKNFYDDETKNVVLQELETYYKQGRYGDPTQTQSAKIVDTTGMPVENLKSNCGFFFDLEDYGTSSLQEYFNNFMYYIHNDEDVLPKFSKESWFFSNRLPAASSVLISYYGDGDFYKPHQDDTALTWLTWVNKEPKLFTGGDLYFPDFHYTIPYENNTAICFYSRLEHGVRPIEMMQKTSMDELNGRFCITHFMAKDT